MKKQELKTSASDTNRPCEQLPEVRLTKKASKFFTQNVLCRIQAVHEALWNDRKNFRNSNSFFKIFPLNEYPEQQNSIYYFEYSPLL